MQESEQSQEESQGKTQEVAGDWVNQFSLESLKRWYRLNPPSMAEKFLLQESLRLERKLADSQQVIAKLTERLQQVTSWESDAPHK